MEAQIHQNDPNLFEAEPFIDNIFVLNMPILKRPSLSGEEMGMMMQSNSTTLGDLKISEVRMGSR